MARRKSEVIALRLPLEVHARATQRAARDGISVGQLISDLVCRYFDPSMVFAPSDTASGCTHPGSELVILPQGMRRCGRCYAVRGRDGVWRRRDPDNPGLMLTDREGEAGGDAR